MVSPHYDDGPLSLGQSMHDGELAKHRVSVGIVNSHSNFTRWFHPTRRRWPLASAIRLTEETWTPSASVTASGSAGSRNAVRTG